MKTSLEKLEGLKRSLTVELPIDTFNQKTDKVLQSMASQAKIDGFRKGKVPVSLLRKRFGASASTDAANEVVNETLGNALEESKSNPVSQPTLTKIDSNDGKFFYYTVEFEVFPEVKAADFSKIKVEQVKVKITKEDEDRTLNGLKEQLTEYAAVKRKSKTGDRLTIDFKGTIDGEVFDGGEAENFIIVLGKGSMIEGFEDGLTDVSTGKSIKLNLTFPKEYHADNLAGKDVIFEINVKDVASPKKPKLD
ncbi:MAG: trigger factor, partial [PS1 clade bacterium]